MNNIGDKNPPVLTRYNGAGELITRFNADGTYNRGFNDRPGYDDRSGADIRGRIIYFQFRHSF